MSIDAKKGFKMAWPGLQAEVKAAKRRRRTFRFTLGLCVLAVTGGGVASLTWLLTVPGASRTVLEASVPYAESALADLIAGTVERSVRVKVRVDAVPSSWSSRARILSAASGGCLPLAGGNNFSGSKRKVTSARAASRLTKASSGTFATTSRKSASRSGFNLSRSDFSLSRISSSGKCLRL